VYNVVVAMYEDDQRRATSSPTISWAIWCTPIVHLQRSAWLGDAIVVRQARRRRKPYRRDRLQTNRARRLNARIEMTL
jgi:excinuclease UvrABC nuclease subunit